MAIAGCPLQGVLEAQATTLCIISLNLTKHRNDDGGNRSQINETSKIVWTNMNSVSGFPARGAFLTKTSR
jgi:hypothetical protein